MFVHTSAKKLRVNVSCHCGMLFHVRKIGSAFLFEVGFNALPVRARRTVYTILLITVRGKREKE